MVAFGSSGPQLVADTGINGFTLQNGTPTILSWTAPNDGKMHRFTIFGILHCTVAETGGALNFNYEIPDGSSNPNTSMNAGGSAVGVFAAPGSTNDKLIQPGSTVLVQQTSALTAGAAVWWGQIWAI